MNKQTIEHVIDIATVLLVVNWALAKTGHLSITILADLADYGVIAAGAYLLYKFLRRVNVVDKGAKA